VSIRSTVCVCHLATGHFAWEDGAEVWGSIALDWTRGGYQLEGRGGPA
jgi:hypothetical protein